MRFCSRLVDQQGGLQMKKRKKTKRTKSRRKTADKDILEKELLAVNQVIDLTDEFCNKFLNEEYRQLCEDMAWAVYEEGLPLGSGKPGSWASGIVHALGWVNFLQDPSFAPYMRSTEVAKGFGVSQETMLAKSRIIRDELDLIQLDPQWCLPSRLKDNPLVWMVSINGFITDARYLPREMQEEAYRLGLIPYIPADEQEPEPKSDTEPTVIKFPPGQNEASTPKSSKKPKDDGPTLFEGLEQ
ncbi:MAG: DUF6398 domain-containing protein [bacterium]